MIFKRKMGMLKTMIDFWGKFPLLGKTFVLLLVGASLFVLANKVFDNRLYECGSMPIWMAVPKMEN